jgi:hypothetical protein
MTMSQAEKDNAKANAVTKGEAKKERPKRTAMDIAIYICGVLFAIGGLWIGYLGVAGHLKDQKLLGLWIFYGTLISVLTGAFLFFHQRIRDARDAAAKIAEENAKIFATDSAKERPELFIENSSIEPFVPGQDSKVKIMIKNIGKRNAYRIVIKSATSTASAAYPGPLKDYLAPNLVMEDPQYKDLVPAGEGVSFILTPKAFTAAEIKELNEKSLLLFITGKSTLSRSPLFIVRPNIGPQTPMGNRNPDPKDAHG